MDRRGRRQRDVHHVEVALGAVGDVVLAAARREHAADEVEVDDGLPLARLLQVVDARELDDLNARGNQTIRQSDNQAIRQSGNQTIRQSGCTRQRTR
eukprot:7357135-Prymnesium_polylepis.1